MARGDERAGSDIDFLVELESDARPIEILSIGVELESIRAGFRALAMPENRTADAYKIVEEIVLAKCVVDFRWYKPPATDELCCYWDDHDKNVLWITASEVHVERDVDGVVRPARSTTWQKEGGKYVGWLLPGAESGSGGGTRQAEVATVLCPESIIQIPAGSICPYCDVVHSE